VFKTLGIEAQDERKLVVIKNGEVVPYQDNLNSKDKLKSFLYMNRFPFVTQLDETTQKELLEKDHTLVLGLFDVESMDKELKMMIKTAKQHPELRFAFLDAFKYSAYIGRVYKATTKELPRIVIVNPRKEVYYDRYPDNRLLSVDNLGDAIYQLNEGKLVSKSTRGGVFTAVNSVVSALSSVSTLGLVFLVLVIVLVVHYVSRKREYIPVKAE
jgi:hypothetical protein